jgi:hypothetical protein
VTCAPPIVRRVGASSWPKRLPVSWDNHVAQAYRTEESWRETCLWSRRG